MSPQIPTAKLTLTYPIYASSFDPENSDFLFIGGGGGEGRSGVKNKIVQYTLFYAADLLTRM